MNLLKFQTDFLREAFAPGIRTAGLSLPRGQGKSTLAGHIVARHMTPGDPWFIENAEIVLIASSIEQSRHVFRAARDELGETDYRYLDSSTRCGIQHKESRTRTRVHGSNAKTALGLVGVSVCIWDEPGSAEIAGGQAMADAIFTAQGKPESDLRVILIGTKAPATAGWWIDLLDDGSVEGTHVTCIAGEIETWDQWATIRRANPLMSRFPESRKVLLNERDQARRDPRLKARFCSYRLNIPTADESEVLLTVDDWNAVCARPVAAAEGRPIVGGDLGFGRAWSAAVAEWPNGRIEAFAVAPGIPNLAAQEKRDRVPAGVYQRLHESGHLEIAKGLRVQPPKMLVDGIRKRWGRPRSLVVDRFRLSDLKDAAPRGWKVKERVTRWSEAAEDIRALRKQALDGPLSCPVDCRALIAASLSAAMVKNDDQGSFRLVKRGTHNQARDDVASALTLAAGETDRYTKSKSAAGGYHGKV